MTTITTPRALLEQALELIESEYVHLPEDAAYKLMQSIRAELAKPEPWFADLIARPEGPAQELAAMDTHAAWHDAPTCDGLWVCNEGKDNPYRWTTHRVKFPISPLLVDEYERWCGPLPKDAKAEGGAA